ncbi:hypothetical protein OHB12_01205 [Nocardia sp. NBC_01730]|nr:hypothetical protein OHB12_01205 [Nocardia sp. NBC_01730]
MTDIEVRRVETAERTNLADLRHADDLDFSDGSARRYRAPPRI